MSLNEGARKGRSSSVARGRGRGSHLTTGSSPNAGRGRGSRGRSLSASRGSSNSSRASSQSPTGPKTATKVSADPKTATIQALVEKTAVDKTIEAVAKGEFDHAPNEQGSPSGQSRGASRGRRTPGSRGEGNSALRGRGSPASSGRGSGRGLSASQPRIDNFLKRNSPSPARGSRATTPSQATKTDASQSKTETQSPGNDNSPKTKMLSPRSLRSPKLTMSRSPSSESGRSISESQRTDKTMKSNKKKAVDEIAKPKSESPTREKVDLDKPKVHQRGRTKEKKIKPKSEQSAEESTTDKKTQETENREVDNKTPNKNKRKKKTVQSGQTDVTLKVDIQSEDSVVDEVTNDGTDKLEVDNKTPNKNKRKKKTVQSGQTDVTLKVDIQSEDSVVEEITNDETHGTDKLEADNKTPNKNKRKKKTLNIESGKTDESKKVDIQSEDSVVEEVTNDQTLETENSEVDNKTPNRNKRKKKKQTVETGQTDETKKADIQSEQNVVEEVTNDETHGTVKLEVDNKTPNKNKRKKKAVLTGQADETKKEVDIRSKEMTNDQKQLKAGDESSAKTDTILVAKKRSRSKSTRRPNPEENNAKTNSVSDTPGNIQTPSENSEDQLPEKNPRGRKKTRDSSSVIAKEKSKDPDKSTEGMNDTADTKNTQKEEKLNETPDVVRKINKSRAKSKQKDDNQDAQDKQAVITDVDPSALSIGKFDVEEASIIGKDGQSPNKKKKAVSRTRAQKSKTGEEEIKQSASSEGNLDKTQVDQSAEVNEPSLDDTEVNIRENIAKNKVKRKTQKGSKDNITDVDSQAIIDNDCVNPDASLEEKPEIAGTDSENISKSQTKMSRKPRGKQTSPKGSPRLKSPTQTRAKRDTNESMQNPASPQVKDDPSSSLTKTQSESPLVLPESMAQEGEKVRKKPGRKPRVRPEESPVTVNKTKGKGDALAVDDSTKEAKDALDVKDPLPSTDSGEPAIQRRGPNRRSSTRWNQGNEPEGIGSKDSTKTTEPPAETMSDKPTVEAMSDKGKESSKTENLETQTPKTSRRGRLRKNTVDGGLAVSPSMENKDQQDTSKATDAAVIPLGEGDLPNRKPRSGQRKQSLLQKVVTDNLDANFEESDVPQVRVSSRRSSTQSAESAASKKDEPVTDTDPPAAQAVSTKATEIDSECNATSDETDQNKDSAVKHGRGRPLMSVGLLSNDAQETEKSESSIGSQEDNTPGPDRAVASSVSDNESGLKKASDQTFHEDNTPATVVAPSISDDESGLKQAPAQPSHEDNTTGTAVVSSISDSESGLKQAPAQPSDEDNTTGTAVVSSISDSESGLKQASAQPSHEDDTTDTVVAPSISDNESGLKQAFDQPSDEDNTTGTAVVSSVVDNVAGLKRGPGRPRKNTVDHQETTGVPAEQVSRRLSSRRSSARSVDRGSEGSRATGVVGQSDEESVDETETRSDKSEVDSSGSSQSLIKIFKQTIALRQQLAKERHKWANKQGTSGKDSGTEDDKSPVTSSEDKNQKMDGVKISRDTGDEEKIVTRTGERQNVFEMLASMDSGTDSDILDKDAKVTKLRMEQKRSSRTRSVDSASSHGTSVKNVEDLKPDKQKLQSRKRKISSTFDEASDGEAEATSDRNAGKRHRRTRSLMTPKPSSHVSSPKNENKDNEMSDGQSVDKQAKMSVVSVKSKTGSLVESVKHAEDSGTMSSPDIQSAKSGAETLEAPVKRRRGRPAKKKPEMIPSAELLSGVSSLAEEVANPTAMDESKNVVSDVIEDFNTKPVITEVPDKRMNVAPEAVTDELKQEGQISDGETSPSRITEVEKPEEDQSKGGDENIRNNPLTSLEVDKAEDFKEVLPSEKEVTPETESDEKSQEALKEPFKTMDDINVCTDDKLHELKPTIDKAPESCGEMDSDDIMASDVNSKIGTEDEGATDDDQLHLTMETSIDEDGTSELSLEVSGDIKMAGGVTSDDLQAKGGSNNDLTEQLVLQDNDQDKMGKTAPDRNDVKEEYDTKSTRNDGQVEEQNKTVGQCTSELDQSKEETGMMVDSIISEPETISDIKQNDNAEILEQECMPEESDQASHSKNANSETLDHESEVSAVGIPDSQQSVTKAESSITPAPETMAKVNKADDVVDTCLESSVSQDEQKLQKDEISTKNITGGRELVADENNSETMEELISDPVVSSAAPVAPEKDGQSSELKSLEKDSAELLEPKEFSAGTPESLDSFISQSKELSGEVDMRDTASITSETSSIRTDKESSVEPETRHSKAERKRLKRRSELDLLNDVDGSISRRKKNRVFQIAYELYGEKGLKDNALAKVVTGHAGKFDAEAATRTQLIEESLASPADVKPKINTRGKQNRFSYLFKKKSRSGRPNSPSAGAQRAEIKATSDIPIDKPEVVAHVETPPVESIEPKPVETKPVVPSRKTAIKHTAPYRRKMIKSKVGTVEGQPSKFKIASGSPKLVKPLVISRKELHTVDYTQVSGSIEYMVRYCKPCSIKLIDLIKCLDALKKTDDTKIKGSSIAKSRKRKATTKIGESVLESSNTMESLEVESSTAPSLIPEEMKTDSSTILESPAKKDIDGENQTLETVTHPPSTTDISEQSKDLLSLPIIEESGDGSPPHSIGSPARSPAKSPLPHDSPYRKSPRQPSTEYEKQFLSFIQSPRKITLPERNRKIKLYQPATDEKVTNVTETNVDDIPDLLAISKPGPRRHKTPTPPPQEENILQLHPRTGAKRSLFRCLFCRYTCHIRKIMEDHVYNHMDVIPYMCGVCYAIFGTRGGVLVHNRRSHKGHQPIIIKKSDVDESQYYMRLDDFTDKYGDVDSVYAEPYHLKKSKLSAQEKSKISTPTTLPTLLPKQPVPPQQSPASFSVPVIGLRLVASSPSATTLSIQQSMPPQLLVQLPTPGLTTTSQGPPQQMIATMPIAQPQFLVQLPVASSQTNLPVTTLSTASTVAPSVSNYPQSSATHLSPDYSQSPVTHSSPNPPAANLDKLSESTSEPVNTAISVETNQQDTAPPKRSPIILRIPKIHQWKKDYEDSSEEGESGEESEGEGEGEGQTSLSRSAESNQSDTGDMNVSTGEGAEAAVTQEQITTAVEGGDDNPSVVEDDGTNVEAEDEADDDDDDGDGNDEEGSTLKIVSVCSLADQVGEQAAELSELFNVASKRDSDKAMATEMLENLNEMMCKDTSSDINPEEVWQCLFCEETSRLYDLMVGHIHLTHNKPYWYACPYCPFGCSQPRFNMYRHMRRTHPQKNDNIFLGIIDGDKFFVKKHVGVNTPGSLESKHPSFKQGDLDPKKLVASVLTEPVTEDKTMENTGSKQESSEELIFVSAEPAKKPVKPTAHVAPAVHSKPAQDLPQGWVEVPRGATVPVYIPDTEPTQDQHGEDLPMDCAAQGSTGNISEQQHDVIAMNLDQPLNMSVAPQLEVPLDNTHHTPLTSPVKATVSPSRAGTTSIGTSQADSDHSVPTNTKFIDAKNYARQASTSPGNPRPPPLIPMGIVEASQVTGRSRTSVPPLQRAPTASVTAMTAPRPAHQGSPHIIPNHGSPAMTIASAHVKPSVQRPVNSTLPIRSAAIRPTVPASRSQPTEEEEARRAFSVFNLGARMRQPASQVHVPPPPLRLQQTVVRAPPPARVEPPPPAHKPYSSHNTHQAKIVEEPDLEQFKQFQLPPRPRGPPSRSGQLPPSLLPSNRSIYSPWSESQASELIGQPKILHVPQPAAHNLKGTVIRSMPQLSGPGGSSTIQTDSSPTIWTCPYCPVPNQMAKSFVERHIRNCHPEQRVVYVPYTQ